MLIAIIAFLGLCFGSFINALVWRVYKQSKLRSGKAKAKYSITTGRSMCPACGHVLQARDLIPVVSWLMTRGRCRYCSEPISIQYPLVELLTALLFGLSYVCWPRDIAGAEIAIFELWLISLVGFIALIVYDIRWMLLPNRIIFPMYGIAGAFVLARCISESSVDPFFGSIGGVLLGGGIFYLLFQFSAGTWIGGGDVKLGFLLGGILASPLLAFLMLFFASFLGTIIILPLLLSRRITRKTRIPFGPFLIASAIIVQLFGADITQAYSQLFF